MHRPLALIQLLDNGIGIEALRAEYESIMDPGPNPYCHDTDAKRQQEWVQKKHEREQFLTLKYGGYEHEDGTEYSPITFANWLVREKGARTRQFSEYCMCEFD